MTQAGIRTVQRPRALSVSLYALTTLALAFGGLIAALIIAAI